MKTENIKQQKLLFKYEGDYNLTFIDENKDTHKDSDTCTSACVNLYCLAQSCFETPDDSIFTCGCGFPECAGIYEFSSWLTDDEVFWKVNDDYFRFDRNQYVEEVKSKINLIIEKAPDSIPYDELDFFGSQMNKETLLKIKDAFERYSELAAIEYPRHKVILCPDDNNHAYINENGKKIGFKSKCYLKFNAKDIFGQDYYDEIWMEDLKKWALKIRNKDTINWENWNSEGIMHAKKMREELPSNFDVWYRFQGVEKEDLHILEQEEKYENN